MNRRQQSELFIDGRWQPSSGGETREVQNPATEEIFASVPEATDEDVERAVLAAARAFPAWSAKTPKERCTALRALQRGILARRDQLGKTIALELGAPLALARDVHVGLPARVLGSMARLADRFAWSETIGSSQIFREAAGVVACITPWNFPLHQAVAKLAPALAAGCTVVLKPSELAPLSLFEFAEIVDRAELPAGVFNLVCGAGPTVGEALVRHPRVDMISFTGSTAAGRRVGTLGAQTVKRVALELGGKSANLILSDADLERAVRSGVENCCYNSGQMCSALSRMLVPRKDVERATRLAVSAAQELRTGDPFDPATRLGPLISERQRESVRALIRSGVEQGAELAIGGCEPPAGLERGFFIQPTVFTRVEPAMRIAREEIFGPVLSILAHDGDEHAVELANDSPYGLAGAVWSSDPERALSVARRLRTGQVDIGGARFNHEAPFGGFKQSGNGRELGRFGLEEFLEVQAVQL